MASSNDPILIILCGLQERIGSGVMEGLKPEYEVVQFIRSVPGCIAEIPVLLRGEIPTERSSELGTRAVSPSRRPVAVVLGGGFNDTFEQVHDAVEAEFTQAGAASAGVAWMRQDATKQSGPVGTPEHGQALVQRVRDGLAGLRSEGKLGAGESRVVLY